MDDPASPTPSEPYTYDRVLVTPVQATSEKLRKRIEDRFGAGRGLAKVADDLVRLIKDVGESTEQVRGRRSGARTASRVGVVVVLAITTTVMVLAVRSAVDDAPASGLDWLPLLESAVNDLIFATVAVWFLYSVPERLQRRTLLDKLHRLRSLAHIVDMHQLSKDVDEIRHTPRTTNSSAREALSAEDFQYYLDYCSELLGLVGKAAALCAEESRDPIVLDTVSTVETLTVSLERKMWQKIAVLDEHHGLGPAS